MEGKILNIDKRGYGFITSPELPFERIFFHWTALKGPHKFTELHTGMRVSFDPQQHPEKGFRAIRVVPVNGEGK